MKAIRYGTGGALALLALVLTGLATAAPPPKPGPPPPPPKAPKVRGSLFTETNAASNSVVMYARLDDGSLTLVGSFATGGAGTGTGNSLGSQGAVALSDDGRQLFAVNAGDGTVSAFSVGRDGLTLENVVPSGGGDPISLTAHGHVLYVLNAGAPAGISGFSVGHDGLTPLPGSTQPLGGGAASPEQVSFDNDGRLLAVAEKGSNTIDTFQVGHDGLAGPAQTTPADAVAPYGFAFDNHDNLIISDAGSAATSSYSLSNNGALSPNTAPVGTNGQAAPCWLVITQDNRYVYTANAGPGTISGYSLHDGQLELLDSSGISAAIGGHVLDEATTDHVLYVIADGNHDLDGFLINPDGSLTAAGVLPIDPGYTGLAIG